MANDCDALLYGTDLFGEPVAPAPRGPVADKFGFPPFSILDARAGDWQNRKRAWLSIGIQSEVGRADRLTYNTASIAQFDFYRVKEGTRETSFEQGTSIFDPVLCEIMYRWFAPVGGQVVDPFAGGSVRGIIAALTDRRYWGCDLRPEQVAANVEQRNNLLGPDAPVDWYAGDAAQALSIAPRADFLFSCPPYADLEVYSDDPRDLSNMSWPAFQQAYRAIIMRACDRLKPDRFAAFVVGDVRDPKGLFRNFPGETVAAFEAAGLRLYNEAILITPVGTAAMRVTGQFNATRKMAKTHQNVLVFVKGDPRKATAAIGD